MDFERVLAMIGEHFGATGEPFGVVGALGVAAWGFSRTTFDVDIVAPASAQAALVEFLEGAGYRTEHRSAGYSNHVHADRDLGRVDVLYVGGETAETIFAGVEMRPGPGGVEIPVPRAEHLAAMKLYGIKNEPTRVLQDLEDVRRLLELPGIDRDEIRAGTFAATAWRRSLSGSTDRPGMLDLERDLPTTEEDVEALRRLAGRMVVTEPADANRLRDPFWTLERALESRFFRDSDKPFEL